jgi:signal transduction histidine kinase
MAWNFTTLSIFYLLAGLINLIAALMIWSTARSEVNLRKLGHIPFFISMWLFFSFLELASTAPGLRLRFVEVADAFNGLIDLAILLFVVEYFGYGPRQKNNWRLILILVMGISILISLTNVVHHLVWTGAQPIGPADLNLYQYPKGPLHPYLNALYVAYILLAFLLLGYKSMKSPKGERKFVVLLTAAIAVPFFFYLVYVMVEHVYMGLLGWALGYALSAMFVTWIYFDSFQTQIAAHNMMLECKVQELNQELNQELRKRNILENELRKKEEEQAQLLEEQRRYLLGIYDLIMLGNRLLPLNELRQLALDKLVELIGCDAVCVYHANQQAYTLEGSQGLSDIQRVALSTIQANPVLQESFISESPGHPLSAIASALPVVAAGMGYQTVFMRQIIEKDSENRLVGALWANKEEIHANKKALINGLGDGLTIILENARLTQENISEAKSQERKRLARDLHDSVTQSLHSITFTIETMIEANENHSPQTKKALALLLASALQALKELRLLLFEFHEHDTRTPLLQRLMERIELVEKRAGIDVQLAHHPGFSIPSECEEDLFYILNESLNNSLKHAAATRVEILFDRQESQQVVKIVDNGRGFNLAQQSAFGLGISNMRERTAQIGAHIELASQRDQGTSVKIIFPMAPLENGSESTECA